MRCELYIIMVFTSIHAPHAGVHARQLGNGPEELR